MQNTVWEGTANPQILPQTLPKKELGSIGLCNNVFFFFPRKAKSDSAPATLAPYMMSSEALHHIQPGHGWLALVEAQGPPAMMCVSLCPNI